MFSGLKSILFGYPESANNNDNTEENKQTNESDGIKHEGARFRNNSNLLVRGSETSALIGQTLNAATTKFTEQLLPQSPSIEQLQSSSHHLLPSLLEQQHEEDKRKKEELNLELNEKDEQLNNNDDEDEDDDDTFNVDSWELLNLENSLACEAAATEVASVLTGSLNNNKTGGILKQTLRSQTHKEEGFVNIEPASRQKQAKVSFETSNLVEEKQTIESIDIASKNGNNLGKIPKKKKNKGKRNKIDNSDIGVANSGLGVVESKIDGLVSNITTIEQKKISASKPVLNYRAALATQKPASNKAVVSSNDDDANQDAPFNANGGGIKRNRPLSTSSWSSSDESWFVTPPPCFTGSSKFAKMVSRAQKESAMENALIEHASIYIASTSKQKDGELNQTEIKESKKLSSKKIVKQIETKPQEKQEALDTVEDLFQSKEVPSKSRSNGLKTRKQESASRKRKYDKAWKNKFMFNWDDDFDDVEDDFENMFEGSKTIAWPNKIKGSKKLGKKNAKKNLQKSSPAMNLSSTDYGSDVSIASPTIIDLTAESETISSSSNSIEIIDIIEEGRDGPTEETENKLVTKLEKPVKQKAKTLVKPIKPERQPGWQLRKKRAKRRPLSGICNTIPANIRDRANSLNRDKGDGRSSTGNLSSSSARSSPSLIDRIGSRIVANLSTYTSGFQATNVNSMQSNHHKQQQENHFNNVIMKKSNINVNSVAQLNMSRNCLDRQNNCAKFGQVNGRDGRRKNMHKHPNGYSIDRKVQRKFH